PHYTPSLHDALPILPAQAIAIFLHDGERQEQRPLVALQAKVLDDPAGIDHRGRGAFLVAGAATPHNALFHLTLVRVVSPLSGVADRKSTRLNSSHVA